MIVITEKTCYHRRLLSLIPYDHYTRGAPSIEVIRNTMNYKNIGIFI